MKKNILLLITLFVCCSLLSSFVFADDYKKYQKSKQDKYFELSFTKKYLTVKIFEESPKTSFKYLRASIKKVGNEVLADGKLLFNDEGLVIDNNVYEYSNISNTMIYEKDNKITITFLSGSDSKRSSRFKRGNKFSFDENITIDKDDFIRGIVFSIAGDIEIFGEVNKDVISLVGDIYIGSGAVVRGDIVSVKGKVKASKRANVYGEINYIDNKKFKKRRHRFTRNDSDFDFETRSDYNRVDGLFIANSFNFIDNDSLLPSFTSEIGYAFASERWRYHVGIEQTLLKGPKLSIGGAFYRELTSEDNWIIESSENQIFALLFTEDFKDYYESEGAKAYVKIKPASNLSIETGYNYRDTKYLRAHRHLWSLFGGDKLFPENYSTVADNFRSALIAALDSTTNASWYSSFDYSTVSKKHPFDNSGWHVSAEYEWSSESLNSDYDYKRYMFNIRRYQSINRYVTLLLRVVYGGSDGFLPMEKRFYLGGPGTLRGYDNKELMGNEFWMLNSEYRFSLPGDEFALSVFWDVARVANGVNLSSKDDIKNNIGLSLYIGDNFNVSLAKRLDRSYDDDPMFYARFKHHF